MAEEPKPTIDAIACYWGSKAQGSAIARTRWNFSDQHLLAAAHFSRQVHALEQKYTGQRFGEFFQEILANATVSVFACVASLEAFANEFYIDRATNFPDLRAEVADKFWELYEQKEILDKFELALLLKNRTPLKRGEQPTQDIKLLLKLRNALTHFKPEWEGEKVAHARLSGKLQGRFVPSQFLPNELDLFPMQWASHGCTSWAVTTCRKYIRAFEDAAGLEHRFDKLASRLTP